VAGTVFSKFLFQKNLVSERVMVPFRRFMHSPLGILIAAILVAVIAGLVVHPRVFVLAGGLLTIVAVGVCWPWLTSRGVKTNISYNSARISEGQEVGVSTEIINHLPWTAYGLKIKDSDSPDECIVYLPSLSRMAKSMCQWRFTPKQRGEFPAKSLTAGSNFPFGVWESKKEASVASRLIVWPQTFPVGPVPTSRDSDVIDGNVQRNKVGSMGDMLGVRPYRRGDSPRRIHWAQSARHDRLIVCELQTNSRPIVQIVLDGQNESHTLGPDGSLEWSIRVAASLAKGWLEAGAQVGLTYGNVHIPAQSGLVQTNKILDSLARLKDCTSTLKDLLSQTKSVDGIQVVISTSLGLDHLEKLSLRTQNSDTCWVILNYQGFGGTHSSAVQKEAVRKEAVRKEAWLYLPSPDRVAHLLRHGTAEALHGS
jgi:uncharacterized protein (DUF58 family)